ncbi:MAG: hypothetical protein HFE63_07540 [Clostridiales bacterium]|nr:hypothetical protein [Clostridiales bacterium]
MKKHEHDSIERNTVIGTAIIIVAAIAIFGFILYWMYSVKLLIIPDSVMKLFGIRDPSMDSSSLWDDDELLSAVKTKQSTDNIELVFDVNYENLRAALLGEPEPEGISQTVQITYYSGNNSYSRRVQFTRYGENFRIERYYGKRELLIIGSSTTMYYLDNTTGISRSLPRADDISPENEVGLPSINDLLAIVGEFPDSEAQVGDETTAPRYVDCELTLLRTADGNVYYVEFTDTLFGVREEYFVSLEYGIIIQHNTYSGDKLVYSCETLSFSASPEVYANEKLYSVT